MKTIIDNLKKKS